MKQAAVTTALNASSQSGANQKLSTTNGVPAPAVKAALHAFVVAGSNSRFAVRNCGYSKITNFVPAGRLFVTGSRLGSP
jgi:hypothetical protein